MAKEQPISVEGYHRFLVAKFISMEPFKKEDMRGTFNLDNNFNTYWTKKIRPVLVPCEGGFRVSEYFRKYLDHSEFSKHWSQSGKYLSKYTPETREYLSFQFFLPLANELILKQTLDDLFYNERLIRRIKTINKSELNSNYPKDGAESDLGYLQRIAKAVSSLFSGYSLSHVNGRFRGQDLMSLDEAKVFTSEKGIHYLFDETTAIIRFIKPLTTQEKENLELIRWTFMRVFVDAILESVNGEAEIWLLETGVSNLLYSWSKVN